MAKIAPMRILAFIGIIILSVMGFMACGPDPNLPKDTTSKGKIDISVDETYKPIIEQQLKVFDSSFPDAHITAHYKPEDQCIKDLLENKSRIALVTRELNAAEQKYCEENSVAPSSLAIARDAVAVIVHPSAADSALTITQLFGILTGQYKKKYTVVFDNEGSSTVRFMADSILKGQKLGANVYAAKGNPAVVDYVSKNPDAIGFIGLSYVSDGDDSTGNFLTRVKVAAIQDPKTGDYNKPYQAYIALKSYPLTRNLYYINRETWQGLGSGFVNFLSQERGQLIFFHSHLFPLRMNIVIRDANIHE